MPRFLFAVLSAVGMPMVPRLGACLLVPTLLAACAGSDSAPRPMHIDAHVEGPVLEVEVSEIPPGREITTLALIDPQGRETPARSRELVTREEGGGGNAGPGVGVGASGGSSSGVRPYISLGYLFSGDDEVRRSQRMTAEIPLPDAAAYAAGWRDWRVALRYRDQLGTSQEVSVPAPAP
jgi:hypothetical protein